MTRLLENAQAAMLFWQAKTAWQLSLTLRPKAAGPLSTQFQTFTRAGTS